MMAKTALTSTLVLCAALAFAQPEAGERQRTISVRGEGRVATTPDQVRLSVQINTQAQSAAEAMRSASGRTREVLGLLKNIGVDEKSVQTSRVSVVPTYDYSKQIQPPPIIGYNATNEFSVLFKGKLMEKAGEFMDKAVVSGASNFGGLQYESSLARELQRTALSNAAADAKKRAEVLAKELNAAVGKVLSITESQTGGGGPIPVMMRSADAVSSAPVMSGELTISAYVDVVFELK